MLSSSFCQISRIGSQKLEATFDLIVEAFSFLDKNGDGKLNKKEVMVALRKNSAKEKSPNRINTKRFSIAFLLFSDPDDCSELICQLVVTKFLFI